jgi:hypothetical protein
MGWFGLSDQMLHVLRTVNADRDSAGAFLIEGPVVTGAYATDERLVPDETVYFVDGERCPLAALLQTTSSGIPCTVIV